MNTKSIYPDADYYIGEIVEIQQNNATDSPMTGDNIPPNYLVNYKDKNGETKQTEVYSAGYKLDVGDQTYLRVVNYPDNNYINVADKVRTFEVILSITIFLIVVFSVFGKKGLKAIISLSVSFFIIFVILLPAMISGYNPILLAAGISTALLSCSMYITHGKSKVTLSALLGCTISIVITVILSYIIIMYSKISGYVEEGMYYIENGLNGDGSYINLSYLVIASIIIGVVGAVDDGAITQAKIVKELKKLNSNLTDAEYYKRAMSVGLDHGGAMINTLVLVFFASSIPNLMFIYKSDIPINVILSTEIVAIEIFRATISSVGLLLAIPLTTYLAIKLIKKDDLDGDTTSHHGHGHVH